MGEILLDKKEALRISVSILNKEKLHGDYGFTALKEAELILKNILETLTVEEELLAASAPARPKPKSKPKKPNKKLKEANLAYVNQITPSVDKSDKEGKTILDLEGSK